MRGKAEELEGLIRDHARLMAAAVRRVCGRRYQALVPDVEQEIHLALWKRLQSGKKIEHPTSYLYKVALTTALAQLRKLAPDSEAAGEEAIDRAAAAGGPSGGLSAPERRRLVEQLLAQLDVDEGRALRAYLAGFNHREVATLYGWSESVARHRIYRSVERLRREVGGGRDEETGGGDVGSG